MSAYPVTHPVFPVTVSAEERASLERETALVMAFDRARIEAFIVPRTTFHNIVCPHCRGGNVSNVDRWDWSPEEPDRIVCRHCGTSFPDPRYPLDRETVVTDSTGTAQTYRYWSGREGYRHYMAMRVENCRKIYMEESAFRLARLHAATGRGDCARQCLRILDRLADVYPHYSPHGIEGWDTMAPVIHDLRLLPEPEDGVQPVPGLAKDLPGYRTPYPYCSGMRADGGDNWFYAEMPPDLALAYDLTAGSGEVEALSRERGEDVGRNIRDFLRATANYARTFPIYLGNMDPSLIRGLAVIGRVIGEPEFVHDALRRARLILDWQFYPDGIWREGSPSYHAQTVHGLRRCLEGPLQGYSDPEGYVHPGDGLHLRDLDASRDAPVLLESIAALDRMRLPNGHELTIHDAWAQTSLGRPIREVPDRPLETTLMWAMGQAILGMGRGDDGVQATLHFSGSYGHAHRDNLDMSLFAHGREMLPDLGYTHTLLRPFSVSSKSHNLVLVDMAEQREADGRLLAWAAPDPHLRFCEAAAEAAYPGIVPVYRRATAAVGLPGRGSYVVDLFRVHGGSTHDWCLHGSADHDQTAECSRPLRPGRGTLLPEGHVFDRDNLGSGQGWRRDRSGVNLCYGPFEETGIAPGDGDWSVTFRYEEPDAPCLRTTVLGQSGTTVHFGTEPSIRRAREMDAEAWRHTMPSVVARREGAGLRSAFAAVHEPYRAVPRLLEIRRLPPAGGPGDAVGILCRGEGFLDYHLFGLAACTCTRIRQPDVTATARYAFVRVRDDRVERMVMVDGTELRYGDLGLTVPESPSGRVIGVQRIEAGAARNALEVDAALAPRPGRSQERVLVEFGDGSTFGLAVREIVREEGRSLIVLDHRPGFDLSDGGTVATHTHHPHREISGGPRFRLPNVAVWPPS